jgi:hypothetical protein
MNKMIILKVSDVAKILQVHEQTVRNLTRKQVLKGKKIGNQWFYFEEDIKNMLQDEEIIHDEERINNQ